MQHNFGKIGLITGLTSFVLLVVGVRNILGHTIEIVNFIAFAIFGLIIGISSASLIYYQLRIAVSIFMISVLIAFIEMYRNYIVDPNGMGADIGILSLFIISSFGLGLALIIQFIVILVRKTKAQS